MHDERSDRDAARAGGLAIAGSRARLLAAPHPLLNGRSPSYLAVETEIGARMVEDLSAEIRLGTLSGARSLQAVPFTAYT